MSDAKKQRTPREPKTPMSPDTRNRVILYSVLGAAVVLGGGYLLMHGKGAGTDNAATAAPVPVHHVAVPSVAAASPSAAVGASFNAAKLRNPFVVPSGLAAASGSAAVSGSGGSASPSAAVGSLSADQIAALQAAGYNVTPASGTPSPGDTGDTGDSSASPSATKSSKWLQVLAGHKQSDGTWTVDVRSAAGTKKNVKAGAVNVDGTVLTYQGEDDEVGVQTYVFTTSSGAGANVVANAKVAPYTGALTSANRPSTLVFSNGSLVGGIF